MGIRKRFRAQDAPSLHPGEAIDDAGRSAGSPTEAGVGPVLVIGSEGWKPAALALVVGGWLAAYLLALTILLIDGALSAVHYTPSQDAVGITAMIVGVGVATFVVVVAVRWWRRPAVAISSTAVTVNRPRPIAVPWPMIAEVISGSQAGSAVRAAPGLVLVNGRFLGVEALSRLAEPVPRPQDRLVAPAVARSVPAYPALGAQRKVQQSLPGLPEQRIQAAFQWRHFRRLFILPLYAGFLVMFPDGNGGAQSGIDVGGAVVVALCFEVIAGVAVLACWVTLTRAMAVGSGWIAWRPRFARRWRVLALADVVSTIDLQWPRRSGVRLSRFDSSGLRLRPAELAAGISPGLAQQLAEHPAATAEFLRALQRAPVAAQLP